MRAGCIVDHDALFRDRRGSSAHKFGGNEAALRKAARLYFGAIQIPTAMLVLYLDLLTLAAASRRRRVRLGRPLHRFAVVIPAHDEEALLPRLLASCGQLDYPNELFDVHVIADNCLDRTAALAREAGVVVHERADDSQRGKGYALGWLFDRIARQDPRYDAYVIVDADSIVAENMLTVFSAHLARGDQAVQCYYGVLNKDQGRQAALRHAALVLYNGVRPQGRDALGLSAGLHGNGMCFTGSLIERVGWPAVTLAEDAEFHLRLLDEGIHVRYASQTSVIADMPTSLSQAQSQNVRWERGRLQLARTHGPRLLANGLARRDPARLDALVELILPPLSMLGAVSLLELAIARLYRGRTAFRLALLQTAGLSFYVFGGLFVAREKPRTYLALLTAPPYAVWKLGIYGLSALGMKDTRWLRTTRVAPEGIKES